jgi:hypothetical protein
MFNKLLVCFCNIFYIVVAFHQNQGKGFSLLLDPLPHCSLKQGHRMLSCTSLGAFGFINTLLFLGEG